MNNDEFDAEAFVAAAAKLIEIELSPESRAGAVAQVKLAAEHAHILLSRTIDDAAEPAPVFAP